MELSRENIFEAQLERFRILNLEPSSVITYSERRLHQKRHDSCILTRKRVPKLAVEFQECIPVTVRQQRTTRREGVDLPV
jgi:hypothetical protein